MINLKEGAVITQTTINQIENTNTNVITNQTDITGLNDEIDREFHHETALFPESSNETGTLTAGAVANVFGAWAEIADNNGIKLSSKGVSGYHMHLSGLILEDASVKDKIYVAEIAYGAVKTIVTRARYMSGNTKVGATNPTHVRADYIPFGELIYARMKCQTGSATLQGHFRYHLDPDTE